MSRVFLALLRIQPSDWRVCSFWRSCRRSNKARTDDTGASEVERSRTKCAHFASAIHARSEESGGSERRCHSSSYFRRTGPRGGRAGCQVPDQHVQSILAGEWRTIYEYANFTTRMKNNSVFRPSPDLSPPSFRPDLAGSGAPWPPRIVAPGQVDLMHKSITHFNPSSGGGLDLDRGAEHLAHLHRDASSGASEGSLVARWRWFAWPHGEEEEPVPSPRLSINHTHGTWKNYMPPPVPRLVHPSVRPRRVDGFMSRIRNVHGRTPTDCECVVIRI